MNYIVLDLEWNQAVNPTGKSELLQFEIIEIGAVKLDEELKEISRYESLIKPSVHKKLHPIIREIKKISDESLASKRDFQTVIYEFFRWCGEDYILCTYGNQDLAELQNNMEYHGIQGANLGISWSYPMMYIDVQKIYGIAYNNNEQAALETAVKQLNLKLDKGFHRALEDAVYTGQILKKLDKDLVANNYALDYYRIPRTKREEQEVMVSGHNEFISMACESKEKLLEQLYIYVTKCPVCGKKCRKKIKWFADNSKYTCISTCTVHGYLEGTLHIKQNKIRDEYYAIRKVSLIDSVEVENVIQRKENIKEKRRQKRRRMSSQ